ncbi:MAG: hypothetical protein H0V81_17930 [Solirubrobacterales bacterium]|nr:hypothetical protein [Solirubrobacterales bacterium]
MLLRVLLVAAGLAVGVWALERDDAVRACNAAGLASFGADSPDVAASIADRLEEECRGGVPLASGAAVLLNGGHPEQAARLARESIRREPENIAGWVAAGTVAMAAGDAEGLALARDRLRALDPRNRVLGG